MKDGLEKMRSHEGSYGSTNPTAVLSENEILKNKIYSFARELSVIGLRYIADRNQSMLRRLSWAVLITFGFGFAVYQINDRIQFYLSFSTTTDIEMVQADQLEFPQVTICNENPVRKSVAEDLGLENLFLALYPPLTYTGVPQEKVDWSKIYIPNITWQDWDTVRRELAQPKNELVYTCMWGDNQCNISQFRTVQTNWGQCYAFVAADYNFTVTRAGSNYGLTLGLFVDQADYLGTTSPSAGFRVLLHDPGEVPLILESAFVVSPGGTTIASVAFSNMTRQTPPYGSCTNEKGYFQTQCIQRCETEYVFSKCGCIFHYQPGSHKICNYIEESSCAQPKIFEYNTDPSGSASCDCPPQCNSKVYQISNSQNAFSEIYIATGLFLQAGHNASELTANNGSVLDGVWWGDFTANYSAQRQYFIENYAVLQIYFSSMQYLDITTNPGYSFMGLLSDIGGALGLLLGATLLTLLEVFMFVWEIIYLKFMSRKKKSTNVEKIFIQPQTALESVE